MVLFDSNDAFSHLMALQKRVINIHGRKANHYFLCNYRSKRSGAHDKLSESLLRFKAGSPADVAAWSACTLEGLRSENFEHTGVLRALGHDDLIANHRDPMALLLDEICKELNLSNLSKSLIKLNRHKKLSLLTPNERVQQLEGVYLFRNEKPFDQYLIFDDICTTSATLSAIAHAILQAQRNAKISFFTFALSKLNSSVNDTIELKGKNYQWRSTEWQVSEKSEMYQQDVRTLVRMIMADRFE